MKTFIALPLITEKSMAMSSEGVYQFSVPSWATKQQISDYISRVFGLTATKITTSTVAPKAVKFRQRRGATSGYKKATVTLVKGQTIADFSMPVEAQHDAASEPKSAEVKEAKTESKITVRSKSKKAA